MQATNVRNLLNLRGQKVKDRIKDERGKTKDYKTCFFLFVMVLLLSQTSYSYGQTRVKYQNDYDHKNLHFGFLIGVGQTRFNVRTNRTFQQPVNTILTSITSPPTTCFRIGGLMNVRLNDYFDFRLLPTVSIYSRSLYLTDTSQVTDDQIQFQDKAWLELPIAIKYKSERRGNIRMYAFAGFRYGRETNAINFINRSSVATTLETRTNDFSIEYGIGLEAFLRYFKFTPELHFSHGIVNNAQATVFRPGEITANQVIERMNTNTVTLMFMFE